MAAIFILSSAFVGISFHPAIRGERAIALILFYGGIMGIIGVLVAAISWCVTILRRQLPPSDLSKSTEQIMRDADRTLEIAAQIIKQNASVDSRNDVSADAARGSGHAGREGARGAVAGEDVKSVE